jgi:hypothetical protein
MKYYLLKFKRNWADEFDCDGFSVVNETEFNQLTLIFANDIADQPMNFGFGSNQGWEGEFTYRQFWNGLGKKEITAGEAEFLVNNLLDPTRTYGVFPIFAWDFEDLYEETGGDGGLEINTYFDMIEAGVFELEFA